MQDYAEIIHAKTARVLARYAQDFYAGNPCYTVNEYGKGKAYYQAFRDTGAFKDRAIEDILETLGIEGCVQGKLPAGVSAHTRTDGKTTYLFVENYTENAVSDIALGAVYEDMLTGELCNCIDLQGYGVRILKSK